MNEGINFADDMGRIVVMIGLPYPNKCVELREKIVRLLRLPNSAGIGPLSWLE